METTLYEPLPQRKPLLYTQVKISVPPVLASAFKEACSRSKVSIASVLSGFMADYCQSNASQKPSPDPCYATRRQRRAAVKRLANQLTMIMAAEERYMGNIPSNLQGSVVFENAEQSVSLMEEALDVLASVY